MKECGTYKIAGTSVDTTTTGDSLECRVYHTLAANATRDDAATTAAHCGHAAPESTEFCVKAEAAAASRATSFLDAPDNLVKLTWKVDAVANTIAYELEVNKIAWIGLGVSCDCAANRMLTSTAVIAKPTNPTDIVAEYALNGMEPEKIDQLSLRILNSSLVQNSAAQTTIMRFVKPLEPMSDRLTEELGSDTTVIW
jgi:hypothetical protein